MTTTARAGVTRVLRALAVRRALAGVGATLGYGVVLTGALVLLDDPVIDTRPRAKETVVRFEVEAPKPKERERPKERDRRPSRTPSRATSGPSAPSVGTSIALPSFTRGDASLVERGASSDIVADAKDVVMTDDTVDEAPKALERTAPVHPARARKQGIEGEVTIALLIDTDGSVREPRVVAATPEGVFDDAALEAIRQWRFAPARYRGEAVRVRRTITFGFSLEGAR